MAEKKRDLLLCHCNTKRLMGEKELHEGTDCFCIPYNKKADYPGLKFNKVIIS